MSEKPSQDLNSGASNSRRKFIEKIGVGSLMAGAAIGNYSSEGSKLVREQNFFWDPYSFGAKGDGKTMDTKSIQAAIDNCYNEGGGTVYLHNGTFLSGTIYLKDNITLHIETGAILRGSDNPEDFPSTPSKYPSITGEMVTHKMFVYAEDVKNITVCGRGTIDGRGDDLVLKAPYLSPSFSARPRILNFRGCENIMIRDITLYNSGSWVQLYQSCKNIVIDGITVDSRENKDIEKQRYDTVRGRNTDGLDILDCRFVRISNCYINSGDDAIVLKSESPDENCSDITITNCIFSSNASGIKTGTDSAGTFKDITISNCTVFDTRCDAISLLTVDGAGMERINVSNILCRNVKGSAIMVRLGNRNTLYRKNATSKKGFIRDVIIENIQGTRISPDFGCSITGLKDQPVENIVIKNINLEFEGGGKLEDVDREIPENEKTYPNGRMFGILPAYGFYIRHAKNIILDEIQLRFKKEDFRPAMYCEDAGSFQLRNLFAQGTSLTTALIILKDIHESSIMNCIPANRMKVFIKFIGTNFSGISLISNQLRNVKQAILAEKESLKEISEYGTIR
jgi:polygalacturonase